MTDPGDSINQLGLRLETLRQQQLAFSAEINALSNEISRLKNARENEALPEPVRDEPTSDEPKSPEIVQPATETVSGPEAAPPLYTPAPEPALQEQPVYSAPVLAEPDRIKANLEKFIGENLINKIGIAITVIGVAIGAKYSIEHQLISPLTRIILGYLMGLGLLATALKLKKDYENFSAVLISGAMAIMFFITYAAYSFYALLPQSAAFILMVLFTAFTVAVAINYNRQVIAHIGLVGAYAVPFLLSEGSGKVAVLFSYTAIINIGILIIAFKKYWKPLYYSSFILTWLIFVMWYDSKYESNEHFTLALVFLSVFFAVFYSIFLAYKLIQKEKFDKEDIVMLLANSFIYYGLGYSILSTDARGEGFFGFFTLCNALIHFVVSVVIYRQKLADRNLFYLVAGLVLVFITLAVPVQLDGNWVTLLWAGEAALLFGIGRTRAVPVYEKLAYPLMFLAFISQAHDWLTLYPGSGPDVAHLTLVWNINFLSSLMFVAAFVFINILNNNRKYASAMLPQRPFTALIAFSVPALLVISLYFTFFMEISSYWNQAYEGSALKLNAFSGGSPVYTWNTDLHRFKIIWEIIYSLLFFSILSWVNIKKIRNLNLGLVNLGINAFVILVFLAGFFALGGLRDSYLNHTLADLYQRSAFNIGIRYVLFAFAGLMLATTFIYLKQEFLKPVSGQLLIAYDSLLYISLLCIASSELIVWMDIVKSTQSNKLGLSILWGIYALLIIILGIWKKKKHLRIGAIALFGITLVKLFFYDISYLDTISKTIVFVSLGILLLIISFLYNKYTHVISDDAEDQLSD